MWPENIVKTCCHCFYSYSHFCCYCFLHYKIIFCIINSKIIQVRTGRTGKCKIATRVLWKCAKDANFLLNKERVAEKSINRSKAKSKREKIEKLKLLSVFFSSYSWTAADCNRVAPFCPFPFSIGMRVAFVYFRSHARTCVTPFRPVLSVRECAGSFRLSLSAQLHCKCHKSYKIIEE